MGIFTLKLVTNTMHSDRLQGSDNTVYPTNTRRQQLTSKWYKPQTKWLQICDNYIVTLKRKLGPNDNNPPKQPSPTCNNHLVATYYLLKLVTNTAHSDRLQGSDNTVYPTNTMRQQLTSKWYKPQTKWLQVCDNYIVTLKRKLGPNDNNPPKQPSPTCNNHLAATYYLLVHNTINHHAATINFIAT